MAQAEDPRDLYERARKALEQGEYESAEQDFAKARQAFLELNRFSEAYEVCLLSGQVARARGDRAGALKHYEHARDLGRRLHDRRMQGTALLQLGELYNSMGEMQDAIKAYEQAGSHFKAIGDQNREADALSGLGNARAAFGAFEEALKWYEQALRIYEKTGSQEGTAAVLLHYGTAHARLGNTQAALQALEQALSISVKAGFKEQQVMVLSNLGMVHRGLGDLQQAVKYYEEALPITREIADRRSAASILEELSVIWMDLGDGKRGRKLAQEALELYQELGDSERVAALEESLKQERTRKRPASHSVEEVAADEAPAPPEAARPSPPQIDLSGLSMPLSPSLLQAIQVAESLRQQITNPDGSIIFTEMVLVGLNEKADGSANAMLSAFGIDRERLLAGLAAMRNWDFPPSLSLVPAAAAEDGVSGLPFSANTAVALLRAGEIAREKLASQIRSRHMLAALLEDRQFKAYEWLVSMGVPVEQVRATLLRARESAAITPGMFAYAAGVASADQTADKDTLGFTPYAQALAEIIIKKETIPPVVFGIYGPWGSGKSTFMSFVRKYLEKWDREHHPVRKKNRLAGWLGRALRLQKRDEMTADQAEGTLPRIVCVRFDAWAYTDSAKLWVGLVRAISEKIDSQILWWQRPFYWIGRGGWKFLGAILLSLLPVAAGIALALAVPFWDWLQNAELVRNTVSIFSAVAGFLGSIKLFDQQKPLSSIVETQIRRLDKTEIEGVTNRIQDELHKTVRDYFQLTEEQPLSEDRARGEVRKQQKKFKLVVLIDELDRCPMEKIVEILESIKLFLAEDVFIVLMAVDARVGAEAIRMHYKDVKNPDLAREYLEKIIQVPIPVPIADRNNLTTYVDSLMSIPVPPAAKSEPPKMEFQAPKPQLLPARAGLPVIDDPFKPFNLEDSQDEKQALIAFAEKYLDSNPRRIKRLLNTYRYVKILATRRGVRTDTVDWQTKMILWLGTTMRWPLFMEEAIRCAGAAPGAGAELWDEVRNKVKGDYCPPLEMLAEFPLKAPELKAFCDLADNFIRENPPMVMLKEAEDRQQELSGQKTAG